MSLTMKRSVMLFFLVAVLFLRSRCHCGTFFFLLIFDVVISCHDRKRSASCAVTTADRKQEAAEVLSHTLSVSVDVSRPLQVPMIVKALHKQLKEKSVKTRQCCFNMLTELVNVLPGALTQHIPVLIPGPTQHFITQ